MVTTRRQSKTIDPPALLPVAPPKRKRSNDAISAPNAAQEPSQPSNKRQKKVKSTARVDSPVATCTVPAPAAKQENKYMAQAAERKARKQTKQAKVNDVILPSSRESVHLKLPDDSTSSDNEVPRHAASQDADGEDADSRYKLQSKRKGIKRCPTAPIVRQTAELNFEEDGLEQVDKSQVVIADASNRVSTQTKKPGLISWTPINIRNVVKQTKVDALPVSRNVLEKAEKSTPQVNEKGKGKANPVQKKAPKAGVPSKVVMFTIVEAIAALSLYKDGTMSMAAEINPESRQAYEPLRTGEYLAYPVKGNYHLGALGRYGIDTIQPIPFSLTVPLSEHSFVETATSSSTAAPSRHDLGFTTLPMSTKAPAVRRPNNYCFTFGRYRGRRLDSVPISYLRSVFESEEYSADAKLHQAFADLYPKGLYESEAESFVFEKGGFKGKRLDEVPKSYLWGLLRKKGEGAEVGGKTQRKALERALEVWEKKQLDLTED